MLDFNFNRIFKARGIEKPMVYLRNAGIADKTASLIAHNTLRRFNLGTIEKICLILRCTPNDFLEWTPNENSAVDESHPLNLIKKRETITDLAKMLNSVPLSKLEEIDRLIRDQLAES